MSDEPSQNLYVDKMLPLGDSILNQSRKIVPFFRALHGMVAHNSLSAAPRTVASLSIECPCSFGVRGLPESDERRRNGRVASFKDKSSPRKCMMHTLRQLSRL